MSADPLHMALRGALHEAPGPARSGLRDVLLVGAGGTLGSALLSELLAGGGFRRVQALVEGPLASAVRGLVPLHRAQLEATALGGTGPDTACLVFERGRHSNGRDEAFTAPAPDALAAWGRRLQAAGVRRLLVVVPHAPSLLPAALQGGFASEDEHALAALGFEQLMVLRPSQDAPTASGGSWLQRVARLWLAQMRFMVPQREQPLRAVRLAALVAELARLLPRAGRGTRIVPSERLWEVAQSDDPSAALLRWLDPDAEPSSDPAPDATRASPPESAARAS